jgi:hypothetical protein
MTKDGIYAVTFFESQYETIPGGEYTDLTADEIIERIAPEDGPRILTEKAQAPHFVTCPLAVAPYVEKTALRFPGGAQGKQRSSAHVTDSAWFPLDCDDITPEDSVSILCGLDGMVFCAFSTHGNGKDAGKVRMRVLLFADRALAPAEWTAAWHVINGELFNGSADVATARMYQAAAVWTAHPERVAQSFRHVGCGQKLSADRLLALAPKPTARQARFISRPTTHGGRRSRYEDALRWLDSGAYSVWCSVCMSLRAAVEVGDMVDSEAREVWLTWCAAAPAERQARNDNARYSPAAMWDGKPTLTMTPGILAASLFARARDRAEKCVRADLPRPLSERGEQAARYLAKHHHRLFEQLKATA